MRLGPIKRICFGLVFFLGLICGSFLQAVPTEAEQNEFAAAERIFQDKQFEIAGNWFSNFVARFPESELRTKAILRQAESRYRLGLKNRDAGKNEEASRQFKAAATLLEGGVRRAGELKDQVLYGWGEALTELGDYAKAAGV